MTRPPLEWQQRPSDALDYAPEGDAIAATTPPDSLYERVMDFRATALAAGRTPQDLATTLHPVCPQDFRLLVLQDASAHLPYAFQNPRGFRYWGMSWIAHPVDACVLCPPVAAAAE